MKITYVTGNYGKYISVKEKFDNARINIKYANIDINEPNINDIEYISKYKAMKAYELIKEPVFVADSGFYINNYPNNPGYPGAFVKRSGVSSNPDKLLLEMKDIQDRACYFLDCLTFYDGQHFYQFFGKCEGTLSKEKRGNSLKRAKSNLWFVFIPKNCSKTLAQMTDEERNTRNDGRTNATDNFINWYTNEYNFSKQKVK